MKHVKLQIVSDNGVEATISTDGRHAGAEDYYATVSISGLDEKRVYGIDPIQSFVLGLKLIEDLTTDKRIGDEDGGNSVPGSSWRIEVVEG